MVCNRLFSYPCTDSFFPSLFSEEPIKMKTMKATDLKATETQHIHSPLTAFLSLYFQMKKSTENPIPSTPSPINIASFLFLTFLTYSASNPLIFESIFTVSHH